MNGEIINLHCLTLIERVYSLRPILFQLKSNIKECQSIIELILRLDIRHVSNIVNCQLLIVNY